MSAKEILDFVGIGFLGLENVGLDTKIKFPLGLDHEIWFTKRDLRVGHSEIQDGDWLPCSSVGYLALYESIYAKISVYQFSHFYPYFSHSYIYNKYLGVIIRDIQQASQDSFLCNYQYLCDQIRKAIFCAQRTTKL